MQELDLKEIHEKWNETAMIIARPPMREASRVIADLAFEVAALRESLNFERNRQNVKEQQFRTMFVELQNVVRKYGNEI